MKSITRLSLALIMFSAFYFITTVHAQAPGSAAAGHMNEGYQGGAPACAATSSDFLDNGVCDGSAESAPMGGNTGMTPMSGDASGMLPTADDSARPIGEGGEGGGPAATDMSDKMINDGGHGANSGLDMQQAIDKCVKGAKTVYNDPQNPYEQAMVEQCKNGNGKCYFEAKRGIKCGN